MLAMKKYLTILLSIYILVLGLSLCDDLIVDTCAETIVSTKQYTETQVKELFDYKIEYRAVTITNYKGNEKIVIIPEKIDGLLVERIGKEAFHNKDIIEEVVLPKTITHIETSSFSSCDNLKKINMPDSIISIGEYAFENCIKLNTNLPKKLQKMGVCAFTGCESLYEITIPKTLVLDNQFQSVNGYFSDCISLTKCTFEKGTEEIQSALFAHCTSLKEVIIPDTVKIIGSCAFYNCINIKNLEIPDSVISIKYGAFEECSSLNINKLPSKLESLEERAFSGCNGIYEIFIPKTLTFSEYGFSSVYFNDCKNLKKAILEEGMEEVPLSLFKNCEYLEEVVIPDSVRYIRNYSFANCYNLKTIKLPESLIGIGLYSFEYCNSLKEIYIPHNTARISSYAFHMCDKLFSVHLPESIKEIDETAFSNSTNVAIYGVENSYAHKYANDNEIVFINEKINVNKMDFDKSSIKIEKGEKISLNLNITPSYVTDKISYTVDNPKVVMIENNYVTGLDAGKVKVIATASNGKKAVCTITVIDKCPFTDVSKSQWYYEYVNQAYQLGLMTGATETLFKPTVSMNRGMVAIVLHRMEGAEDVAYAPIFPDVYDKQYFTTAVMWAKQTGIITGYNNGTFMPLKNVTREEMATMIQRFAKYKGLDVTSSKDITYFQDYADISTYAKAPIQWCVENGVLSGKFEGTKVDPLGTATRAECAKMLSQAYKVIYNK